MRDRSTLAARLLLVAAVLILGAYVFCQGVEKFCTEAIGTWVLFPIICIRLCPSPLNGWLIQASGPFLSVVICLIPVLAVAAAVLAAVWAYHKGSLTAALASLGLLFLVFGAYHAVKPMGLRVIEAELPM